MHAQIDRQHRKLGHLRELIATVEPEKIKATKQMCKTLNKKKLKDEPLLVQPDAKSLKLQFNHPVGKLTYQFDKKNTEKLKQWLALAANPAAGALATTG